MKSAKPSGSGTSTRHVAAGEGEEVLTSRGDLMLLKADGWDTAGAYALIEWRLAAGEGPAPHVHAHEDEAFYVLDGSVEVTAGGESFDAGPGSFVLLPRRHEHCFRAVTDTRLLTIMSPAGFEQLLRERSDHLRSQGVIDVSTIAALRAAHDHRMTGAGNPHSSGRDGESAI